MLIELLNDLAGVSLFGYISFRVVMAVMTGFALALVLMAGVREKLDLANVPQLVRGTAAALVVAGVLSMAFMGFAGLG